MQIRKWKAFLRLRGETLVETDQDILNEFKGFVQALKRVGIEYSIVVNVEEGQTEQLVHKVNQRDSLRHGPSTENRTERIGG